MWCNGSIGVSKTLDLGSNPNVPAKKKWFCSVVVITPACHAGNRGFKSRRNRHFGFIAQSVEHRIESPGVVGSIPTGATSELEKIGEILYHILSLLPCL